MAAGTPVSANLRAVIADARMKAAAEERESWPEPVPLTTTTSAEPFPIEVLPDPARVFVAAQAEALRAPLDMPAAFALSVMSAAVGGCVEVVPWDGWSELAVLWVCLVSAPGTLKSPPYRAAIAPLVMAQGRLGAEHAPKVAEAESRRRIEEKRLADLERAAAKADALGRLEAEGEALEQAAALAEAVVPEVPRLFTSDATPEVLGRLLHVNDGRFAWLAAEATLLRIAAGQYSNNGSPNLDLLLCAWSGDPCNVDRLCRQANILERPTLTVGIAAQPRVLRRAGRNEDLRGRGLLDRFLFHVPDFRIGWRDVGPTPSPGEANRVWDGYVAGLLDAFPPGAPVRRLGLAAGAVTVFTEWLAEIEEGRRPSGLLAPLEGWAAKLGGSTLRLAAILAVGDDPTTTTVSVAVMRRAVVLARYYVAHARAAVAQMSGGLFAEASQVAAWIITRATPTFSRRDCHRAHEHVFETVEDLAPTLDYLEEAGWIRTAPKRTSPKGGRPSPSYLVNPRALSTEPTQPDTTPRSVGSVGSVESLHGDPASRNGTTTVDLSALEDQCSRCPEVVTDYDPDTGAGYCADHWKETHP